MTAGSYVKSAAFVLAVIAVVYVVQKKGMKIPLVGAYLPGGE